MIRKANKLQKKRHGRKYWSALLLFILVGVASYFLKLMKPQINAASEYLTGIMSKLPILGDLKDSSILINLIILDLVIIMLSLFIRSVLQKPTPIKRNFGGIIVSILLMFYGVLKKLKGILVQKIFPWLGNFMKKMIEKQKKHHGTFRWIVLGLLILTGVASIFFPPVKPQINAGAEYLTGTLFTLPVIGAFKISNSMIGILLVDLVIILLALSIKKALRNPNPKKRTFGWILVQVMVMLYELTERTAGKWARKVFPWFLSITLVVLVSNYTDLIPGVGTIGLVEPSATGSGIRNLIPGFLNMSTRNTDGSQLYSLIPFLRSPSTDLNFTLALALIVVVMIQITGLKYQGTSYLKRFFNIKVLFTKPGLGVMEFIVGILELITEFSKILSFSFRLFGSIFAGLVLFALSGTFIPVIGQTGVMAFELFMGLIQALVFGLLTMVFMSQAMTISHLETEEESKINPPDLKAGKSLEELT